MPGRHHVYLVPGFFGFANLGDLVYFGHARDLVSAELARGGVAADVVVVRSHPTASLQTRMRELAQLIVETAGSDDGPIHLIGHSSGGLDARLLVSPPTGVQEGEALERIARRVRTVVTLSTPHHGTPLASFFTGIFGPRFLQLLSLFTVYVLRFGRVPLPLLFKVGAVFARADRLGWRRTLLDQVFSGLLGDFSPDRQAALTRFLSEIGADQRLIPQLTPEAMAAFNAATPDRSSIHYGSVVTQARPPSVRSRLSAGLDPYTQLTHSVYALLYRRAARVPIERLAPTHSVQAEALKRGFGRLPRFRANDGIVPTLSQPWGTVLAGAWADHLDTLGHFDQPDHVPAHVDWLISGSGFRRPEFERLWAAIVRFLVVS